MATTKVSYKKSGGAENKQLSQLFSESLSAQKSAKTVFQKMKVDEIKFDEKGEFQKTAHSPLPTSPPFWKVSLTRFRIIWKRGTRLKWATSDDSGFHFRATDRTRKKKLPPMTLRERESFSFRVPR